MNKKAESSPGIPYEFHIAGDIRKKYQMHSLLFGTDGRVVFADFRMVRQFVFNINQNRTPEMHLYPGEVYAAGLLDEIFHLLLRRYEQFSNPQVFSRLRARLMEDEKGAEIRAMLLDFVRKFPPMSVSREKLRAHQYLQGKTDGRSNLEITIEEALMLYFANINPANHKMCEFFDEQYLDHPDIFEHFIAAIEYFFQRETTYGPDEKDIFTLLKAPMKAAPDDLNAQLEFVLAKWKSYLPETITLRVLGGMDLMKEDVSLEHSHGGPILTQAPQYQGGMDQGAGITIGKSGYNYVLEVGKDYDEYEHFTSDTHWMPKVVMMAKNTYVWLDQLSKKYHREIRTLDQVPDQELDLLAQWNITGLWLIGIWERSSASQKIKHIMGNTDAVSSAYSLFDYKIAADLGGDEAFMEFNARARERGIRLAGDMVPNHTGIFSQWMLEKPDYFIQSQYPPFPGYQFTGEDLSPDTRVQIRLEDGYYTHQDAAVVFQRIDSITGDIRYVYHGNDGTMMPWNDTAQLDFLKQEVREAVIQKIFEVARKFSIIRFDAAMTLAKKHFARLWYPRPGTGGDIASRADFAMPQSLFDEMFPVEFWREVVDRINKELPDTLLLAEAFWFMEGYFVRTLGMHRVYNSAFMHMLKNEENSKYRDLITNTLEFEPEILKRYVNFMSNPDEETSIRQFGTGDKYFGICVLMNTLPGLPMFGHGQVEGYTEKYGMEYQRAYYNELPNQWLIDKHQREIFPLTAKRYIFSEVEHFNFFDFNDDHGQINENVMAYTNRYGDEQAMILFNNKYESASGSILQSAPRLEKASGASRSFSLAEALMIQPNEGIFYIFREHISGLEYILSGQEINQKGFHWNLQGFEYRVFIDIRELVDQDGDLRKLYQSLGGGGVPSMDKALKQMQLRPVHDAFERIFDDHCIQKLTRLMIHRQPAGVAPSFGPVELHMELFLQTLHSRKNIMIPGALPVFRANLQSVQRAMDFLENLPNNITAFLEKNNISSLESLLVAGSKNTYRENIILLLSHYVFHSLHHSQQAQTPDMVDALKLYWPLRRVLERTGQGVSGISRESSLIRVMELPGVQRIFDFSLIAENPSGGLPPLSKLPALTQANSQKLIELLEKEQVRDFLGVNLYNNIWYYSRENFEELLQWLFSVTFFDFFNQPESPNTTSLENQVMMAVKYFLHLREASHKTGYEVNKLKETIVEWA